MALLAGENHRFLFAAKHHELRPAWTFVGNSNSNNSVPNWYYNLQPVVVPDQITQQNM
jgi:hypothetical protein